MKPEDFLKFNNGVLYFRFANFGAGPDIYHLLRNRINVEILGRAIRFKCKDLFPNYYSEGVWIENGTKQHEYVLNLDESKWRLKDDGTVYVINDFVSNYILCDNDHQIPITLSREFKSIPKGSVVLDTDMEINTIPTYLLK